MRARKIERKFYELTAEELAEFPACRRALNGMIGYGLLTGEHVWTFWKRIARVRGLDYRSIIGVPDSPQRFSALPLDHGKHWCWPMTLQCVNPPLEWVSNDG